MAVGADKAARETSMDARESMLILGTDGVPGKGVGVDLVIRGTIEATIYHPPLVDVAWRDIQILLDDPTYEPRKLRTVRPFVIQSENAPHVLSKGLPLPDVE
ncbi:MAG: hypothetical protein EBZ76_11830 [Synechococcaceae bacterium WB9_2_170]|nr:hypothetical protein [Synechococcaceae bacterium WB9_2_170]